MSPREQQILASQPAAVPRYTSYPPANHFAAGEGAKLAPDYVAAVRTAAQVSVYVHIPFCDRLCWFCGCHTKHTLRYEPVHNYVGVLLAEIELWKQKLGRAPVLSKLHLGGGSPSLLSADDLVRIRAALQSAFVWDAKTDVSIEIDPTDVGEGSVEALMAFGLTRASIGVQDFDPDVQMAINRPQSFSDTARVVEALRAHGVTSINIDALYGLPRQSEERLLRTIAQVASLGPDRVALFGYAHVPWMKPHQKLIEERDLPDSKARFEHARKASATLVEAGYEPVGIDHFARPHDRLAQAAMRGELRRNFQGYTDDATDVLVALGPSSVGRFPAGYVQNEVAMGQYAAKIATGHLPLSRGLGLTADDHMRGWVIERLMCDFAFCFEELRQRFGPKADALIEEAEKLAATEKQGLCEVHDGMFIVPPPSWPFVRLVASRFDAWLELGTQRYSKAV